MIIGGLQKFSLLDYPGHIAAIIFTQGCNFRCHYCYNPMLVVPARAGGDKNISSSVSEERKQEKGQTLTRQPAPIQAGRQVKENGLFCFLKERLGKLEGVVITGGEPTGHSDLPKFIKKIKKMGYLVKLDTNGTNPSMLKELIDRKLIDYIAMDIKASAEKYSQAVGVKVSFLNIKKSVKIVMESGLPYEFRTTIVPGSLVKGDIKKIGALIMGAEKWFLQKFKSNIELVNRDLENIKSFTDQEMREMREIGRRYVKICEAR